MTLGARLRAAREAAGLNQVVAAVRLGTQPRTLSRYENDLVSPQVKMLVLAAELYGVRVADLIGEDAA